MRRPLILLVCAAACGSPRTRPVPVDDPRGPEVTTEAAPDGDCDGGSVLRPTDLTFDGLPMNSFRVDVFGYDAAADKCVHAIWDFSNNDMPLKKHCDDFFETFPYVFIGNGVCKPTTPIYQGNVGFASGKGCIDFGFENAEGMSLHVDVKLRVTGPAFTGAIELMSPR